MTDWIYIFRIKNPDDTVVIAGARKRMTQKILMMEVLCVTFAATFAVYQHSAREKIGREPGGGDLPVKVMQETIGLRKIVAARLPRGIRLRMNFASRTPPTRTDR